MTTTIDTTGHGAITLGSWRYGTKIGFPIPRSEFQ
jgi:hypothetical protein